MRKNLYLSIFILSWFIHSTQIFAQSDSLSLGTISFELNVDSALLILNNQFAESYFIKNGSTIKAKSGLTSVKLSVIHDHLFEQQFYLRPDSQVTVSHTFNMLPLTREVLNGNYAARKIFGANVLLITDDISTITLNDEEIGMEFIFTDAKVGNNNLVTKFENDRGFALYTKEKEFTNSDYTLNIVESYIKTNPSRSRMLSVIPGTSQNLKHEYFKSLLIRSGLVTAILSTSTFELSYRSNRNEFDDVLEQYQLATNQSEATLLGNELDDINQKLERDALIRNFSLFTAISIYIYNLVDGIFIKPKFGYQETKPIDFYLNSDNSSHISANISINF